MYYRSTCINNPETKSFRCICKKEYYSTTDGQCIPYYDAEREKSESERQDEYTDYFNGVDLNEIKAGAQWLFYEGTVSSGGDYMAAPHLKGNHEALKQACMDVEVCIGKFKVHNVFVFFLGTHFTYFYSILSDLLNIISRFKVITSAYILSFI